MVEDTATRDVMVDLNNSGIEGTAAQGVLDAGCMAELRALDPDGKAQLVKRVLVTYDASLARLSGELVQARADRVWDQVSRVAHTLKSSSASIGALALAAICSDIERLLRAGEVAAVPPLLDRFVAEAARVERAVKAALADLEATGA